jgi:HAD superfamily phosphatase (TIGR01668 family)
VLADIGGKPMLQHVLERCCQAREPVAVVLCTDSLELETLATGLGIPVLMTASECSSGSERIGSVARQLGVSFTTAAGKPRRSALRRVLADLELPHGQVALVGDRLFTDVLAGNRLGLFTVLVKPVDPTGQPCQRDRLQAAEVRLARWLGAELH